jgi:hypothetical protein
MGEAAEETDMTNVFNLLVHSTLLSEELAADIRGGIVNMPKIVDELLIAALDVEAVVRHDGSSTWNEKRIARQVLVLAFLSSILALTGD